MQEQTRIDTMLADFMSKHKLSDGFIGTAQKWYIPLANRILMHRNSAKKPFFVGVNGCQGSGKSTLSAFIEQYLIEFTHLKVVSMSLDDFYYSKGHRLSLAVKIHPLLKTRGVPGTHNTSAMFKVLSDLKTGKSSVAIPRFDKATDDPFESSSWPIVKSPVDVVIVEGWCWGVKPQQASELAHPINQLERQEDELAVWRHYVNSILHDEYLKLYQFMDFWIMLKAPSFDNVLGWRIEQEHKLRDAQTAQKPESARLSGIMTDTQVKRFIQHYQRLTEHGIDTLPDQCDVVFMLDQNRQITDITGDL